MVARDEILLTFYLDLRQIERTYSSDWDPYLQDAHVREGLSPRTEKFVALNLAWDLTLWMWTRFRIGDTEFFECDGRAHPRIEAIDGPGLPLLPNGHSPCPRAWIPVIVFALNGLWALRAAVRRQEPMIMLANVGDLIFRVHRSDVEVKFWEGGVPLKPKQSTRRPRQATVAYADLLAAWEAFSEEVRTQFLEVLPELAENEEYGPWFRQGLDYLRRQPL